MSAEQDDVVERALWMSLRALEEKLVLSQRMADSARSRGSMRLALRHEESAQEARDATETIRRLLLQGPGNTAPAT